METFTVGRYTRQTERQTERQTDRQTERQTDIDQQTSKGKKTAAQIGERERGRLPR